MATIVIEDLSSDQALDRRAMAAVIGGQRFGGFGWMLPYQGGHSAGQQLGGYISQTIYNIYDISMYQYQPNNTFISADNNVGNSGDISIFANVAPTQVGLNL